MFYSQDILTSRKHGVATIWLVATLGSRSSLKRVNRKAILDVNVTRACWTITDPSAPIALRLQGSLLYGVSRVFSQQCTYVLSDMESLRDHMRSFSRLLKEQETDPNVTTTRAEQLNLPIDSAFSIDLDLGFDLSGFDTSFSSEYSSLLSPRTLASSQTSILDDDLLLEAPLLPQYSSSDGNDGNGIQFVTDDPVNNVLDELSSGAHSGSFGLGQEDVVVLDPDIALDDDGIVFLHPNVGESGPQATDTANTPVVDQEDDGFQFFQADDDDGQILAANATDQIVDGSDADVLSRPDLAHLDRPDRSSSPLTAPEAPNQDTVESTPSFQTPETETVEIAQQRRGRVKLVPVDNPTQISNHTMATWNTRYSEAMDQVRMDNMDKTTITQGRRNAAFWVLEQGIGSVHTDFQADGREHPLSIFTGQMLLDALGGVGSDRQSKKRSASAMTEEEGAEEDRHVRPRSEEQVQPDEDAEQQAFGDDQDVIMGDHGDEQIEIEPQVGRAPQAPLSEHSDMPWNTYVASSRQGSTRPLASLVASSSVGGTGAFDIATHSMSRRISRLVSESPLDHRRMRDSSRAGSVMPRDDHENDIGGQWLDMGDTELDQQLAGSSNGDFELDDPVTTAAALDPAYREKLSSSLDQEAFNFFSFLEVMIEQKEQELDIDVQGTGPVSVTFEELLLPENEDNVVAAQGFLHVLSLATRGLIIVQQVEDFGDITLSIARDHFP